jgi:hypothetical protein
MEIENNYEGEGLSPVDAKDEMNSIAEKLTDRNLAADNPDLHRKLTAKMAQLAKQVSPESPTMSMNYESLQTSAQPQQSQADLISVAESEMDRLSELGFDRDKIPNDVKPFQVDALKMQRLNAEENFLELSGMIEKEMAILNFKGMDGFRTMLRDASLDPATKKEFINLILHRVYDAHKELERKTR